MRECAGMSLDGSASQRSFVVLETRAYRHGDIADIRGATAEQARDSLVRCVRS